MFGSIPNELALPLATRQRLVKRRRFSEVYEDKDNAIQLLSYDDVLEIRQKFVYLICTCNDI